MRNIFLMILLLFLCGTVGAQINLSIKSMKVSNIDIKMPQSKKIIDEEIDQGPFIYVTLLFTNNNDSAFVLFSPKSELTLSFHYKGESYSMGVVPYPYDRDTMKLLPQQNREINFGANLLIGTRILKANNRNYTKEMLEILPTISVLYRNEGVKTKSTEILDVKIE